MYEFMKVKVIDGDDHICVLKDWLLKIDTIEKASMALNRSMDNYIEKWMKNGHINTIPKSDDKEDYKFLYSIYHPINLSEKVSLNIVKAILQGKVLLFQRNGSYSFFENWMEVKLSVEKEEFVWPIDSDEEMITISQFKYGSHFYLRSTHREFPNKYDNFHEAYGVAEKYVKPERINVKK